MKITKYTHACVVIEDNGSKLIIDPGEMTSEYGDNDNIAAVVITHAHSDHFSQKSVDGILAANPNVKVFTTNEVASKLPAGGATVAKAGQTATADKFNLEFFGQKHATVHPDFPVCDNFGVLVNDRIYYGGDSFTLPNKPVELLLAPISGPWLKMQEVIDYVRSVKPQKITPTHDGLNSETGNKSVKAWFDQAFTSFNPQISFLTPSQSLKI